jgi:hypothetical protein
VSVDSVGGLWSSVQSITILYVVTVLVVYKIADYHDSRVGLSGNFSLRERLYVCALILLVYFVLIFPVLRKYLV